MENNKECDIEISAFQKIVNSLKEQNAQYNDLSNRLQRIADKIVHPDPIEDVKCVQTTTPLGFVNTVGEELYKLNITCAELARTIHTLEKIIGN